MNKYIHIIIAVLFMVSCENEIPFDVKSNPPKLVVNALFESGKDENEIVLALTGKNNATFVTDASINIYVNGELKDQLTEASTITKPNGNRYVAYVTKIGFAPNDIVKIEVKTKDNKHTAWAEVASPKPIDIDKITSTVVTKDSGIDANNDYLRVRTTFTDDGKQDNYYRIAMFFDIEIETRSTTTYNDTIIYQTLTQSLLVNEDVVLTDGNPTTDNDDMGLITPTQNYYGVFDNSRINGQYTMTTSMQIPYYAFGYSFDNYGWIRPDWYANIKRIKVNARVKLLSISKMQYLYLKALNIYDSVEDDFILSSPIKFPSNIEGGTGIFGLGAGNETVIALDDYYP